MKNFFSLILFSAFLCFSSCKKESNPIVSKEPFKIISIDSTDLPNFFLKFPDLKKYQSELENIYAKHNNNIIWKNEHGIKEFANVLHHKIQNLNEDGINIEIPHFKEFDQIFSHDDESKLSDVEKDILISSMYFHYVEEAFKGIDEKITEKIGWLLPRKKTDFTNFLDSLIVNPKLLDEDKHTVIPQYHKLKFQLHRLNEIDKNGNWAILPKEDKKLTNLKFGDSSKFVLDIKNNLHLLGDLKLNNKTPFFDDDLKKALISFQKRHNRIIDSTKISQKTINDLNVSPKERIKKILLNMERCRWLDPELMNGKEYVFVNIPAYHLNYVKNNKTAFDCNVVVGKSASKTVIFSGNMSYIVFSPYWNVPQSIINKEVKPGMKKEGQNYLTRHHMEWNNGRVRQTPGDHNSLGLVKFIFPNSNNIYLHDTPSKSLFNKESRAFSHGCIRVGKPKDLAVAILKDDKNWTEEKINKAMHTGKENSYVLKNKIPVIIGYFTAWVNENNELIMYEDIYERDDKLSNLILH
ncbi:L,D-transpeptidase family protein [Flavobacterium sp. LMO8]|uniref:L,D-transpeptidase family protein n=1 Tax=Flavobacterium sp. LMO8 TaxID=2654244 RepID=UPI001290AE90|nr:L,D-transpeptidase family protein [Flavobacterium sp. LMO8]MQP24394.1 L,D-transpeptidase family protein [Flavobacterium sp. LMO8]